jgi:predicted acetyltransferase
MASSGGMTDIEVVNPVPIEEATPWLASVFTTLLGSPYAEDFPHRVENYRREWLAEQTWGARADGRWVATLATEPRTLTVPGGDAGTVDVVADALSAVAVNATHRRRGLLTTMLGQSLRAAKDRGDAVAILVAAEWGIYGRFGYAPATEESNYVYHPRLRNAGVAASGTGSVRQVEADEAGKHAAALFDRARRRRPGQVDRRGDWWPRHLGLDGYRRPANSKPNWILREGRDGPDGLLAWRVTRDFELDGPLGAIEVPQLIAASDDAYRDLWAYLSGIDVVEDIALPSRPVDEPARWLLGDGRALRQSFTADALWVRLLDVPAALAARRYAVSDRVVLDVVDDDLGGYGAGRVALEGGPDGASCQATTETADLRLSQRALAGCYLGGHSLRQLMIGGGVEELRTGAVHRADAMFASAVRPWNATMF